MIIYESTTIYDFFKGLYFFKCPKKHDVLNGWPTLSPKIPLNLAKIPNSFRSLRNVVNRCRRFNH